MPAYHQRIPIHSVPWSDDDKPSYNDLSSRLRKTLSRYHRFWFPRSTPLVPTALPVPASNLKFVLLCSLWYTTSALSSNTGKAILMQFRYPVTLTFVQFGFVAAYCLLFMSPLIQFSRMRQPNRTILRNTVPMGMFQVGGHIFSSLAISRIPVSTVHTIKALSPLFTVAAYAVLFGVSYSSKTYISLLPLTIGVILASSSDMSASNFLGLLCALGSALVFVSSNIFFKKVMPSNPSGMSQAASQKLDKLNLLLYSSGMAFVLMIPIWLYYDLPRLLSGAPAPVAAAPGKAPAHSVGYYFFMNGTVHFAQNIIAFVILASTSPVTYSIASLFKRVAVICMAIVWFSQSIHLLQGIGILMTFGGLYMYNNAKADVDRGEKQMRRVEAARDMALPTTKEDARVMAGPDTASAETTGTATASVVYGRPRASSSSAQHAYAPPLSHPHLQHHHPNPHQHSYAPPSHQQHQPQYPHSHSQVHHGHHHQHPHPEPLKIRVTSTGPVSPTDSYPSPPLSNDSPHSSPPLAHAHALPPHGHGNGHMHFEAVRRVPAAA